MAAERLLHFNAFLMSRGHHEAAWRLPESDPSASLDVSYRTNLARIAERGTFDSIFRGRRVHQVRLGGGDASSDSYCYPSE